MELSKDRTETPATARETLGKCGSVSRKAQSHRQEEKRMDTIYRWHL